MIGARHDDRRRESPPFSLAAGLPRDRALTRSALVATALAVVLASTLGATAPASAASAAAAPDAPDGEITVESDHVPDFTEQGIAPGDPAEWRITGTPTADADVRVDIAASGDLSAGRQGLWLELERCSGPWTIAADVATCAGTRDVIVDSRPFADVAGRTIALGHVAAGTPVRLLAEVRAGSTPPDAPVVTASVDLTLHASGVGAGDAGGAAIGGAGAVRPGGPGPGSGDTVASGTSGAGARSSGRDPFGVLAWTGSWSGWTFLAGLGAALVVGGVATRITRRRRPRSRAR